MVLGASAAVAYMGWKNETIALDAVATPSKRGTSQTPRSPEPLASSQAAPTAFASSTHEKHDATSTPDDTFLSEEDTAPSPSSEQDPVGEAVEEVQDNGGGGAFNPVTGEINWDCPCLGGMAHGPCGVHFREAFSCFVFSEQEPKGIDCVEKFKAMQDCFREHSDVYGDDIMDDDDDESSDSQTPDATLQDDKVSSESVDPVPSKKVPTSESSTV
ncbi:hypothetical protein EUX98_g4998 [Antrodiella citrinella]|uniref:Mitochondrial intermembrane space import and assembly protein 40 n=1 Tax=Antrodiella citrinella TaxID=2447956 RepID=A0A4S4MSL7_9APHY|nr:hypothetical protein EUX98_g4998 [Antrodiella citrinella]